MRQQTLETNYKGVPHDQLQVPHLFVLLQVIIFERHLTTLGILVAICNAVIVKHASVANVKMTHKKGTIRIVVALVKRKTAVNDPD